MGKVALSSWEDRFFAWLIDVLLMSIIWHRVLIAMELRAFSLSGALCWASLLFIYWTALEGYRGQSFGKMILNISVTGPIGEHIRFRDAALESFGKSFLLPLDCLACWFFFRDSRQRLFNKISNTVVVKQLQ
ncbi:MAG: RDD family protein [Methanosaeta sp. PtaB.Bin039]|nr:MAG: RDD family protein [Methanosaeta sp. PtaB.Bin039]